MADRARTPRTPRTARPADQLERPTVVPKPVAAGLRRIGLHPELWAGLVPNGVDQQKPRHFKDMLRIAKDNSKHPRYAWEVLTKGVCDGCALGVAGLHDWTIDGVHLCTTRLELLEFNTADAMNPNLLSDAAALADRSGKELRSMGRLAHPMRRRRGERGFTRITWEEALDACGAALRDVAPERMAMFLTSRGLTNETYYVAGKAARALGTANIDSAARTCHAPSTLGLKATIGVAASTCSLRDVLETDLVVLWGTNPANNQPVFMKHLEQAKRNGAKVIVINPFLEPGLDRYWVPSSAESAVFGTRICDMHVPVRPGGDIALSNALMKALIDREAVDHEFVDRHTTGWSDVVARLDGEDLDDLIAATGVDVATFERLVEMYSIATSAVLIWSMGITQHTFGVEAVRGIVNVGLARGNVGRNGAGLMPIRGHSGVQGGSEMGAYATALPGGVTITAESAAALSAEWGFDVPNHDGLTATEMVEAAGRGDLDVIWMSGTNFLEVLPDPVAVAAALGRVPTRIHQDVVVTSQMLVEGDDVILLPVTTRYEQEGGGTSTTTERRIAFSPEIPRQVGEARSEWRLFGDVVTRARPALAEHFAWPTNQDLRSEIARVVPSYAGIEFLERTGDAVQWGGRHLCAGGRFPLPEGRARFSVVESPLNQIPDGRFLLSTRRGKQFNSIVWSDVDPLTGATRDAVYMDRTDAHALGLTDGDAVVLRSDVGEMAARVRLSRLPPRTVQVHWPEANVLLPAGPSHREPGSRIPDYQAFVEIVRA